VRRKREEKKKKKKKKKRRRRRGEQTKTKRDNGRANIEEVMRRGVDEVGRERWQF
jgi:hypothetical protein